ncbi:hypothetical protein GB937_010673 [Aspergillus fischeri]|nr:hypothetical protein GB937_010673 [Aspergillus fischeri]
MHVKVYPLLGKGMLAAPFTIARAVYIARGSSRDSHMRRNLQGPGMVAYVWSGFATAIHGLKTDPEEARVPIPGDERGDAGHAT